MRLVSLGVLTEQEALVPDRADDPQGEAWVTESLETTGLGGRPLERSPRMPPRGSVLRNPLFDTIEYPDSPEKCHQNPKSMPASE